MSASVNTLIFGAQPTTSMQPAAGVSTLTQLVDSDSDDESLPEVANLVANRAMRAACCGRNGWQSAERLAQGGVL